MTHASTLARADALTDALRIVDHAIGQEPPTDQALRIIEAIKRLRDDKPARVQSLNPVDYLSRVQSVARIAWNVKYAARPGDGAEATATLETPLGPLSTTVWRRRWTGKRGERVVWAGTYTLAGEPISIAEIKAAGLAQRPTTRRRKRNA